MEPEDGLIAICSGGNYALAAARALMRNTRLSEETIVMEAMKTAAEICVYTNDQFTLEVL